MSLSVFSLPIDSNTKRTLYAYKFRQIRDLQCVDCIQLSEITRLSLDKCEELISVVEQLSYPLKTENCVEFLKQEMNKQLFPITSFNRQIDEHLLNGGFPLRKLVEIYGIAASGKTQLCLQLCVNVQIPQCFGGVEGEVLFIETENSFIPSRFVEIASHTIEEIKQLLIDKNIPIDLNSEQNFTCETLMKHIYMKRCSNAKELYTIIVHKIEEFLKDYSQVKLIIIDSIAFPFRYDYEDDNMEKIKMLLSISQKLKQIAFNHSLCVVVTNQITHDVEESKSKASLGPTWSHCSNVSILLEYDRNLNKRYISTTKNFHKKKKLEFEIDARGFRGKEKIV